jgi:hypothetical protein
MTEQLALPYPLDERELSAFVTQVHAIDNEHDRLREELRTLKECYETHFPVRHVLTALKVVRARQKLAEHAKEPLSYMGQRMLEAWVAAHLVQLEAEGHAVPEMTGD